MASTTTTLEIGETPAIDVAPAKAVTSETKGKSATACSNIRIETETFYPKFARNAYKKANSFCLLVYVYDSKKVGLPISFPYFCGMETL